MVLPLLLFILVLLLPILLLLIRQKLNLNLPPSPPKLPIIGNVHQLGSLPHRSLHSLSLKHGPLMLLHLGQTPTLVVSSPELVKEIAKSHDITFSNRHQTTAAKLLFYNCRDMAYSPYGEHWRQTRKLCVQELLSSKSIHSFQYIRDEEVENLLGEIEDSRIRRGFVNLTKVLYDAVNSVTSRIIFGRKADSESKFGELTRKVTFHLGEICIGDYFPWLRWVDFVGGRVGRMKETFNALDGLLDEVIEEHRRSSMSQDDDKKDFVDILLELQKNNMLDMVLTQNDIKAVLLDMFVAGTDTSSTVIEWAMTELIRNPNKMKKAQEEVRAVMKKNNSSKVEMKDIDEMKYLKCVVKETLRKHTPAPFLIPRENASSVKLCGYDIPKKSAVIINMWAIHMDPEIWVEPNDFIPERFLNNLIDYKGFDFNYLPFGIGRRMCPGMNSGSGLVEYVMTNFLYWYDWKLFGCDELDVSEVFGLTLTKRLPLLLEPISYSP